MSYGTHAQRLEQEHAARCAELAETFLPRFRAELQRLRVLGVSFETAWLYALSDVEGSHEWAGEHNRTALLGWLKPHMAAAYDRTDSPAGRWAPGDVQPDERGDVSGGPRRSPQGFPRPIVHLARKAA